MKKLLAALALFLVTSPAFAEGTTDKQPTPDELRQIMEASFGAMVPAMERMTEAMIEAQLRVAEKPETAMRIALFKKNVHAALLKQGFSKEEAMDILLNTPVLSAMPGMK